MRVLFTKRSFYLVMSFLILCGVYFRFVGITQNTFVYYDEGMWLNQNRDFVDYAATKSREGLSTLPRLINISFHLSIQTAKSLWAFIAQLRAFLAGPDTWYFVRVVAAVFGVLTIPAVFFFTKRFYDSWPMAVLAAAMIAVLPSHVYYSRIGLQETLTAFLFVVGLHSYLRAERFNLCAFFSGILFSLIYFANYRMIIIPVILAFVEGYLAWTQTKRFDWRRYALSALTFAVMIFCVGMLDGGANAKITSAWMFRQADLAEGTRSLLNFLSFPYYLFRLESVPFGFLFFTSIYFFAGGLQKSNKSQISSALRELFPFSFACFLMILFSLPQDKAARYLCVGMPFMAIATARVCFFWWENKKSLWPRLTVGALILLLFSSHIIRSHMIARFTTDYASAIKEIRAIDPTAKFISSQYQIQSLFVNNQQDVLETPKSLQNLLRLYSQGYRYFILDPQAYVSMTEDGRRFHEPLRGYVGFINRSVKPLRIYSHFSYPLLERFVFEHNENLRQSIEFLDRAKEKKFGELRVYDLRVCLSLMQKVFGNQS